MRALIIALLLTSSATFAQQLPNSVLTPGKADISLTKQVICDPKFNTDDYRRVSDSMKNKVYLLYNVKPYAGYCSKGCEVDHLVPLTIGGSNAITNLWPQPYYPVVGLGAYKKDALERKLHTLVCTNKVVLEQAQKDIASDWVQAYTKYMPMK